MEDNTSNSTSKDPAPAVEAISVSFGGTPLRKFTVPYGIPITIRIAQSEAYNKQLIVAMIK